MLCLLLNAHAQIILNENFSGGLPAGWSVDSAGVTPVSQFYFNSLAVPSGIGFTYPYVRTGASNSNLYYDYSLTTSIIDASALSSVYLGYSERFAGSPNYLFGEYLTQQIEVSNDSGITWVTVLTNNLIHGIPSIRNVVDITQAAAGYNNVRIRFHYIEHDAGGEWSIDSVVVASSIPCTTPTDTGKAATDNSFACPGTQISLHIDALSRGVGQTYQWQYKNATTAPFYTNFVGATSDTFTTVQNMTTYYRCNITCNGLTAFGGALFLTDTPAISQAYSTDLIRICTGRDDTVRMRSPYGGPGVVYNWRWSPTHNGTYTDIPGATNDYYVVSAANYSSNTSFWCRQICAANGAWKDYNWMIPVDEPLNPNPFCYCYPFSGNDCSTLLYYISNVAIAGTTLNNTSGCIDTFPMAYNNHAYFTPALGYTTANLVKGITYTFSITSAVRPAAVSLWIDYNRNNDFDANEYTYAGILPANIPQNITVTIPTNAQTGLTGLRIRGGIYAIIDSVGSCLDLAGGTTQDYLITIDSTVSVLNIEDGILNIAVHPNPSKGETTITSPYPIKSLKLVTVTGSVVFSKENVNDYKAVINVKELPQGIYFVEVETEKGMAVKKLVKI
jgi:GEVED domain/Secretion system C-terminal sorting domain